ncbi:MAG TPA: MFS transporter [Pseudomonadales bacterium]|nr:MFS transporter [Pseudomonadales bacterium]
MARINLAILITAQMCFTSGSILLVTIGGIVGSRIAPSPALATLPVSLMVVGTALATVPAALLMQRFGRRAGFCGAALIGIAGSLAGARAMGGDVFWLFCAAALTIGFTLAFAQQFRFAAAESVVPERAGQAVSFILLGSIGGALLGPELVARSAAWDAAHPFRAALVALAGLQALAGLLLLGLRPVRAVEAAADATPPRPLGEIVRTPLFAVAVLGGLVGQGVMTFLMTATPVSMHVVDGHGMVETAEVIRAHVVAMYLPSLVSAALIARFGPHRLMAVGAAAMVATVALGLSGQAVIHYWFALVLLGVGWNFLFVGGTTLLVGTYRPSERFRAQAVNDFSVFGTSALASLLAGTVMLQLGWTTLLLLALPPLVLILVVLWRSRPVAGDEALAQGS